MPLLIALTVTWLTLVVVIVGACTAAGRADREAAAQTREVSRIPVPTLRSARSDAPFTGASTLRSRRVHGVPRGARRGAHGGARHPRLARR